MTRIQEKYEIFFPMPKSIIKTKGSLRIMLSQFANQENRSLRRLLGLDGQDKSECFYQLSPLREAGAGDQREEVPGM